jgi:hypothetical protein
MFALMNGLWSMWPELGFKACGNERVGLPLVVRQEQLERVGNACVLLLDCKCASGRKHDGS